MIIQGTNEPIVLEFPDDMTEVQSFSALLVTKHSKVELKRWDKDTITIKENSVELPLTQEETMGFAFGNALLQIKWKMNNEIFADESEQFIKRWLDKTVI